MANIREMRRLRNVSILSNQLVKPFNEVGALLTSGKGPPRLHLWVIVDTEALTLVSGIALEWNSVRELRSLKAMRSEDLQKAITTAIEAYASKKMLLEDMEEFQDLIYAELNHRMTRGVHRVK